MATNTSKKSGEPQAAAAGGETTATKKPQAKATNRPKAKKKSLGGSKHRPERNPFSPPITYSHETELALILGRVQMMCEAWLRTTSGQAKQSIRARIAGLVSRTFGQYSSASAQSEAEIPAAASTAS